MSIGRNDPCPCGNGKKYKNCCLGKSSPAEDARKRLISILAAVAILAGVVTGMVTTSTAGMTVGFVGLGLIGAWLWLFAPPARKTGGADPSAINYGR